jgi:hypothetical protein
MASCWFLRCGGKSAASGRNDSLGVGRVEVLGASSTLKRLLDLQRLDLARQI